MPKRQVVNFPPLPARKTSILLPTPMRPYLLLVSRVLPFSCNPHRPDPSLGPNPEDLATTTLFISHHHHRSLSDAPHLGLSGLLPLSPSTKHVILSHTRRLHPWTWIVLIANFLALGVMALVADLPGTRISYCITLSLNSNSRRRSYVRLPMAQHPRSISMAAFVCLLHRHLLFLTVVRARPDSPHILQVANRLGQPSPVPLHPSDRRLRIRASLCGLQNGIHLGIDVVL